MRNNWCTRIILGLFIILNSGSNSCTKKEDFQVPQVECEGLPIANISAEELQLLYNGETVMIQEDLVIEGYVISSDRAGNFFGSLHFQNSPQLPTSGFQLEIDLADSYLFYQEGSRILIKLKGLYFGKSQSVFKLGGVDRVFGNEIVGRLPANLVKEHIFKSCEEAVNIVPMEMSIQEIDDRLLNNLIQIKDIELVEDHLGQQYAIAEEDTPIELMDCDENRITLLNSGYSDFQNSIMPSANGSVTAVLQKANKKYQLIIRDTTDLEFKQDRCNSLINEMSSNKVFITEIADPDNNSKARFIELYNAGESNISLDGWTLKRYTNENTEASAILDLGGQGIPGNSTFVISADANEFELIYGFKSNSEARGNSVANSNGDDNIELVDPFGVVIDVFGRIGEDGSGTDHEFEDGRAIRKPAIVQGNREFSFDEWIIYNDTGEEGTIKLPQNAPEDFSPGIR